jgi:hypothetical protein
MKTRKTQVSTGAIVVATNLPPTEREPPTVIEPGALTVPEFCAWSRVGRTSVFEEIRVGRLTVAKIGHRTIIPMECAKAWLKAMTKAA